MPAVSAEHARLGAAIRAAREAHGWTIEELAHRIPGAVSIRYLAGTERGETNVTFSVLIRICAGLGVKLEDLIASYADRS